MVKTAINTLIPKQVTSSLRITAPGTKKATSKDLRVTKVNKAFKDVMDVKGSKGQQGVMVVTEQQDVTVATVKTS